MHEKVHKVKKLLGLTGPAEDDLIEIVLQTIEDRVLSYIGHDVLPPPLENVILMMAVSYYKSAGLGNAQAASGPVASVKRGDVQTSFATAPGASGSAQTFNLGMDGGDFLGWKTVLNEYRKLRW